MRAVFFFSFVFFSACSAPHHQLVAPSRAAPLAEREAAYDELKPVSVLYAPTAGQTFALPAVLLPDGRRIAHAEDLLPVVDPASPTALSIQQAQTAETQMNVLTAVSVTALSVGVATMFSSLALVDPQSAAPLDGAQGTVVFGVLFGGAGLAFTSLLTLPASLYFGQEAAAAKTGAFLLYERDLAKRLDLPTKKEKEQPPLLGQTTEDPAGG